MSGRAAGDGIGVPVDALVRELVHVPGVVGVVLGGSRARGTHHAGSDVDLGVYVESGVDREGLSRVASTHADARVTVGPSGSWGPWVDSGAWLHVDGMPVDLIVRDIDRVEEQCARARRGHFAFEAQAGHPFGFLDVSYAGELATSVVLEDPAHRLATLRASVTPYPAALRASMLDDLWMVDFTLDAAQKAIPHEDAVYIAHCVTSAILRLGYAWHAFLGSWVTNEKGLITSIGRLNGAPEGFGESAGAIVERIGDHAAEWARSIGAARDLPRPGAP